MITPEQIFKHRLNNPGKRIHVLAEEIGIQQITYKRMLVKYVNSIGKEISVCHGEVCLCYFCSERSTCESFMWTNAFDCLENLNYCSNLSFTK